MPRAAQIKALLPVLTAFANGEPIQFRRKNDGSKWDDLNKNGIVEFTYDPECYRVKPKTININGFEIPEPVREIKHGARVYVLDMLLKKVSATTLHRDSKMHKEWLRAGTAHWTEEAAELHHKALLSFTEQPVT